MSTRAAPLNTATLARDGDQQTLPAIDRPRPSSVGAEVVAPPADRPATRATDDDLTQLRRFQWAVRAALALGVAASVCANVLHARHNLIAQTIAAWPPLALMLAVELISRVPVYRRALATLRILATVCIAGIAAYVSYFHMAAVVARYGEHQPNPYLLPISVDGLIVVASVSLVELAGRVRAARDASAVAHHDDPPAPAAPPRSDAQAQALSQHTRGNGNAGAAPAVIRTHPATAPPHVEAPDAEREHEREEDGYDIDPELAALLPAAHAAREALHRTGRSLTRDSLAAQLRRDGHTIRTSRVSALLSLLRNDGPAGVTGRRRSSSNGS